MCPALYDCKKHVRLKIYIENLNELKQSLVLKSGFSVGLVPEKIILGVGCLDLEKTSVNRITWAMIIANVK